MDIKKYNQGGHMGVLIQNHKALMWELKSRQDSRRSNREQAEVILKRRFIRDYKGFKKGTVK